MDYASGEVLFYNKKKKFGAIKTEGDQIVFFKNHSLEEGDKVSFVIKEGSAQRTLNAVNITRVV